MLCTGIWNASFLMAIVIDGCLCSGYQSLFRTSSTALGLMRIRHDRVSVHAWVPKGIWDTINSVLRERASGWRIFRVHP